MSQVIQNRFTKTAFDAAQSVYVGEGKLLTARYMCQGRAWKATIQWKPGYERDYTSMTALDEASMKSALLRIDNSIRFIGKVGPAPTPTKSVADEQNEMLEMLRTDPNTSQKAYESACQRYHVKPKPRNAPAEVRTQSGGPDLAFKDAQMLEALRVDITRTSDIAYRNACVKFGVPPRPRPARPVLTAPQTRVPFHVQGEAFSAFMQAHGELFGNLGTGVFAEQNYAVLAKWMEDESCQMDAASLDRCYRECFAAGYFRDARTLSRDMSGSLRVVRPYNHAELVALRRRQTADIANQPPAGLSAVDAEAWQAVRSKYPTLPVNSTGFKQCMRDTVSLWARQHVSEEHPEWFSQNPANGQLEPITGKRAEVQQAADRVLVQWIRAGNPKLKIGGVGSRVHLD